MRTGSQPKIAPKSQPEGDVPQAKAKGNASSLARTATENKKKEMCLSHFGRFAVEGHQEVDSTIELT